MWATAVRGLSCNQDLVQAFALQVLREVPRLPLKMPTLHGLLLVVKHRRVDLKSLPGGREPVTALKTATGTQESRPFTLISKTMQLRTT